MQLLKGSVKIPIINKRVPNIAVGTAVGLVAVGGYFYLTEGEIPFVSELLAGILPGAEGSAIPAFDVSPAVVQPGSGAVITVRGAFMNAGKPATVPTGFWNVVDESGAIKGAGSLGSNISTFTFQIPTSGYSNGTHTVTVSDTPLGAPTPGATPPSASPDYFEPPSSVYGRSKAVGSNQLMPQATQQQSVYVPPAIRVGGAGI